MGTEASSGPLDFRLAVQQVREGILTVKDVTERLLSELSATEKLSLLTGARRFWPGMKELMTGKYKTNPWVMGEVTRLNIPGVRFCDGPRGSVLGQSTCFPVAMARGATWDVDLEARVAEVIARESRAQGVNISGAICINLPRHPSWGRIQETYGEDPILLGELGIAAARGTQKAGVMACVKHFALNSMEDSRFKVDVTIDQQALREVYLQHFEMVVKEGQAESVMSSYNSVNGEWAGQNDELLNKILKEQWGFQGFVVSDWVFGLRDSPKSVKNGLDLEAPFQQVRLGIEKELSKGKITIEDVDRAATRVLRTQVKHYATRNDDVDPSRDVIFSQSHRDLAREVAARSMVLLKNEPGPGTQRPLLPLDIATTTRFAMIGSLADSDNTGDWGSSYVKSPESTTPYAGIKAALSTRNIEVTLTATDDVVKATEAARNADVVVLVVGYGATDEGENLSSNFPPTLIPLPSVTEAVRDLPAVLKRQALEKFGNTGEGPSLGKKSGGDRKSIRLSAENVKLIRAVGKTNPNTIVAIIASGAVIVEEWIDEVNAVLMAWYIGCEGGHALADVILGQVNVSGRLPFSVPRSEADLPPFNATASKVTYDKWFGQRLLDRNGVQARYPLGYGLSYTAFEIGNLQVEPATDHITVQVSVTNIGQRSGHHVVQVYGLPTNPGADFPTRVLLGFSTVNLAAGESQPVRVKARIRPLQRWHEGQFSLASDEAEIEVGSHAGDTQALRTTIRFA